MKLEYNKVKHSQIRICTVKYINKSLLGGKSMEIRTMGKELLIGNSTSMKRKLKCNIN